MRLAICTMQTALISTHSSVQMLCQLTQVLEMATLHVGKKLVCQYNVPCVFSSR